MKLIKEHIDFQRGIDPKEAMGTGDIIERAKQKYYPMFLLAFKPLLQKYTLNSRSLAKSIVTNHENVLHRIEISYKGKMQRYIGDGRNKPLIYFIGFNFETKNYFAGYEVWDEPIEQDFGKDFNEIKTSLERYVDKNEDELSI